jgi:4-hydroxybenzoate polyprenyltransferase
MNTPNYTTTIKTILFDLSRIGEWWLLSIGLVLFAFIPNIYKINDTITIENIIGLFTTPELYIALIVVFSAQIFLFASNDYFDRHIDALDEKKKRRNPACTGKVSSKQVYLLLFITATIAIAASLFFSFYAVLFTIFSLFVFYFYTAEPLRFKNKVGADVLTHGILINTFPYFFCLIALSYFTTGSIFLLVVLMLRSTMAQLLQEVRDYEVDRQVERNTVVVLGQRKTIWIVFMMYLALFVSTSILLIFYQLYSVGISLFYLLILFLCIAYIPTFIKLLSISDNKEFIDGLWMGQGRINHGMRVRYTVSFMVYFGIIFFIGL